MVDTIDAYHVAENTWETITVVPAPRYHAGIVSIHKKIYFIGGFHNDSLFDRATGKSLGLVFISNIAKKYEICIQEMRIISFEFILIKIFIKTIP